MNHHLFHGQLVRLVAANSETDAELFVRWASDSEYMRLQSSWPTRLWSQKQAKEALRDWMEHEKPDTLEFMIRTLAEDRPIGSIGLDGIRWQHGDTFVGIGIGERGYWGKGYGTDAMRIILRYAFVELNLHRISLDVFEYNPRAIRSYEKCGFVLEGRTRDAARYDGQYCDEVCMGILRNEWEQRNA